MNDVVGVSLARALDPVPRRAQWTVVVPGVALGVVIPRPKLIEKCTLPLTGIRCVHHLCTDLAWIDFTSDGPVLREVAPGVTVEEVVKKTGTKLILDPKGVNEMKV